jgi:hypothetical protein
MMGTALIISEANNFLLGWTYNGNLVPQTVVATLSTPLTLDHRIESKLCMLRLYGSEGECECFVDCQSKR